MFRQDGNLVSFRTLNFDELELKKSCGEVTCCAYRPLGVTLGLRPLALHPTAASHQITLG